MHAGGTHVVWYKSIQLLAILCTPGYVGVPAMSSLCVPARTWEGLLQVSHA